MPKVRFLDEVVEVDVEAGETLLACAERAGVPLFRGFWTWGHRAVGCPRSGLCGACRVWASGADGALSPRDRKEARAVGTTGTARLACRARVLGDVEVRTLPNRPAPSPDGRWDADPRPSKWQDRLRQREAELAVAAAGAPAAGDDEKG